MKKLISSLAIAASMTAGAASAATIVNGFAAERAQDAADQGYTAAVIAGMGYGPIVTLGELDQDNNNNDIDGSVDPFINLAGDSWIFGRAANNGVDRFTIDARYETFDLQAFGLGALSDTTSYALDFGLKVDGSTVVARTAIGSVGTIAGLTGMVEVSIFGGGRGTSGAWMVDTVNVNQVPLPASSLLLLGGLGGLAAMRRKKTA